MGLATKLLRISFFATIAVCATVSNADALDLDGQYAPLSIKPNDTTLMFHMP